MVWCVASADLVAVIVVIVVVVVAVFRPRVFICVLQISIWCDAVDA